MGIEPEERSWSVEIRTASPTARQPIGHPDRLSRSGLRPQWVARRWRRVGLFRPQDGTDPFVGNTSEVGPAIAVTETQHELPVVHCQPRAGLAARVLEAEAWTGGSDGEVVTEQHESMLGKLVLRLHPLGHRQPAVGDSYRLGRTQLLGEGVRGWRTRHQAQLVRTGDPAQRNGRSNARQQHELLTVNEGGPAARGTVTVRCREDPRGEELPVAQPGGDHLTPRDIRVRL